MTMTPDEAESYLSSFLNKNLRITTTDGRLFWGQFKCTDPDANIVLTGTHEYHPPTATQIAAISASTTPPHPLSLKARQLQSQQDSNQATSSTSPDNKDPQTSKQQETETPRTYAPVFNATGSDTSSGTSTPASGGGGKGVIDVKSRYLGLVVVPGKHIRRIESEEFASQMRK